MKTPRELAGDYTDRIQEEADKLIERYGLSSNVPGLHRALCSAYMLGIDSVDGYLRNSLSAMRASVRQNQWISVKERLPERSQKVLALGKDQTVLLLKLRENHNKDIFGNWEYVSGFDQDVNGRLVIDTTHWMPLPEPPKES